MCNQCVQWVDVDLGVGVEFEVFGYVVIEYEVVIWMGWVQLVYSIV